MKLLALLAALLFGDPTLTSVGSVGLPAGGPHAVQDAVSNGSATFTTTMGATPTDGNELVAFCAGTGSLPVANTILGWTSQYSNAGDGSSPQVRVVYKVAASETTTEVPCTGLGLTAAAIYEVSGFTDFQKVGYNIVSLSNGGPGGFVNSNNPTTNGTQNNLILGFAAGTEAQSSAFAACNQTKPGYSTTLCSLSGTNNPPIGIATSYQFVGPPGLSLGTNYGFSDAGTATINILGANVVVE